eukprot:5362706-Lingulodinium_polyedra.AAC.1
MQSPTGGPGKTASSGGPDWPSQLTHGCVIATYPNRTIKVAEPFEYLQAMGFNTISNSWPRTPMLDILKELPIHQVHRMCGNAMHLPTEAAWMLYCIMHTSRRDHRLPATVTRQLQDVEVENDEDWSLSW